ncbi:MAG TPA: acyltransferase domain-containing protein [Burkholderiaceae bacterium]|jgi:[acyl-carrier-protein] S-malonyltransferase
MSLALLFPGQGVQYAGMLSWLESEPLAAPALAALSTCLGPGWRERLVDEDWASSNRVAQPLMTCISLAAWRVLAPQLPQPTVVAGYSVGEIAAFSAAGLYDVETALRLALQRATLMDACTTSEPAGLMSVSGLGVADVALLAASFDASVAIRLGADRCILGGKLAALAAITAELLARGAELKPLRVRVASHTSAMIAAAAAFEAILQPLPWSRSTSVIACNLDGTGRRDPNGLKQALARQIDHTVAWDRCMTTISERRPACVLEVGPSNTLARMWSAAHPEQPARSVDDFQSAQAVIEWVRSSP